MSRRIFRLLLSVGFSIFFLFTFAGTSIPVSAHTISSRPNTFAHAVATKSPSSVTPHDLTTNVVCTPQLYNGNLSAWTNTKNGPASYGCGGNAWQINTPTDNSSAVYIAAAEYDMGTVTSNSTYNLRAFITAPANAAVNYDISFIGVFAVGGKSCVFNQSTKPIIGWNSICTFGTGLLNITSELLIIEWSGQAHHGIMSASAIQLLPA